MDCVTVLNTNKSSGIKKKKKKEKKHALDTSLVSMMFYKHVVR